MSDVNLQGSFGGQGGSSLMFRNKLINGNFDVWQRADSQTSSGYGSDDRWNNLNVGSTKTHSKVAFALGQTDVPGNPKYFSRTVVSSVAGASNYVLKAQSIEGVNTLAGKKAILSFWAKADTNKDMAIEFYQNFAGGSANVSGIGAQKVTLTTSWKRHEVIVDVPSVAGKTTGINENDNLTIHFWFDAGSNFNSRTDNLGQQSGTFDIAQVQLEEGSVASPFDHRPYGLELSLCQRYYWRLQNVQGYSAWMQNALAASPWWSHPVEMRTAPSITKVGVDNTNFRFYYSGAYASSGTFTANIESVTGFRFGIDNSNRGAGGACGGIYFTGGYLDIDAEL